MWKLQFSTTKKYWVLLGDVLPGHNFPDLTRERKRLYPLLGGHLELFVVSTTNYERGVLTTTSSVKERETETICYNNVSLLETACGFSVPVLQQSDRLLSLNQPHNE